jgi:4-diphosphocytidyl-2-C-methyl-D-erythritol kinase
MIKIKILAPAKINLLLYVLRKRYNGYHEIYTLMVAVNLFDKLTFLHIPKGIELELYPKGIAPEGEENLVYRAAKLIKERYGIKEGIKIFLEKIIPTGAGLGGGSSDAAATIEAMNKIYQLNRKREELSELGATLGADVPFFFWGGLSLCSDTGTQIMQLPYPEKELCFLTIIPKKITTLSSRVYSRFQFSDKLKSQEELKITLPSLLSSIYYEKKRAELDKFSYNALEPTVMKISSKLRKLKENLALEFPNKRFFLTGSGSAMFAYILNEEEKEELLTKLATKKNIDVKILKSIPYGVKLL